MGENQFDPGHPAGEEDDSFRSEEGVEGTDYIVLGRELASAAAAEERRLARGNLEKSPMPDQAYDHWRGDTRLIRPVPLPLDSAIAELCKRFATADERTREGLRSAISMDEFYTLLAFAKRAAVFAIRGRDAGWVEVGMTAIALVECNRVDYRDILMALSLLHHAAGRAGMDTAKVFRDAASRSEPDVARLIIEFIGRSDKDRDIRSAWGYEEIETDVGIGFIGWGFHKYEPTYDLKAIALAIADFLATDKYLPSSVEVATELPRVWIESGDRAALDQTMKSIRASASVTGSLRPEECPDHHYQQFTVFLTELANESDSQRLLEIAGQKHPTDYCMIPLAVGRLFCLIVARSFVQGIEAFETGHTLTRFAQPITDILRRGVAKDVAIV
jgi:hypothetical protein